ncbi:MAG: class I SAM-dependent methyltransferase [Chthoniobacterales bacterium]
MSVSISATSALVLNWTDPKIWQSPLTAEYMRELDLSEGQSLLERFSEVENLMHTQTVSCRKFFVRKTVCNFLGQLQREGRSGQVVILAAGLAPMSVEIASLFPSSAVFDVDLHNMDEKRKLLGDRLSNIAFGECDITDIGKLDAVLTGGGFRKGEPTIVVLEGILYYICPDALRNLASWLAENRATIIGEFGLKPELVNEETRVHLLDVFAKIQGQVKMDGVTFYSDDAIIGLFRGAGFGSVTLHNFQPIQKERTGDVFPFTSPDSSWIKGFLAA